MLTRIFVVVALIAAIAIPRLLLAGDPWLDASRFVRVAAHPGDLVILPADRVERLPSLEPAWAIAADSVPASAVVGFRRIFAIAEADALPPQGLTVISTRQFGHLSVRECAPQ